MRHLYILINKIYKFLNNNYYQYLRNYLRLVKKYGIYKEIY